MTGQPERPEDKLERMLSGGRGVPLGPEHGGELAAMSEMADALREAGKQIPAPARMEAALSRMLAEVGKGTMNKTSTGGFRAMLAAWWSRPVMRTAMAAVAAVTVVSGVGLGAAAAMGQADPVRQLLGISSSSTIDVELTGTVVSIDGNAVKVDANGDVRTIVIDETTKITAGGNDGLTLADIIVGGTVEVHGKLLPDNSIQATRFHLEDDIAGSPTAGVPTEDVSTPGADPTTVVGTPAAGPTEDHDDDDGEDEDNSGPGDGDDDGDNDDNSGPGNGDDDGDNNDNSGPGNGDDDGDNEDHSGSGGGDDDGDNEDHSGSGGGDDDDEEPGGSSDGSEDDE